MNSLSDALTKLKQAQKDYDRTDSQMAHLLGCSRQLWQMTRTGKIPPGKKILTFFLTKDADMQTIMAGVSTTPHQTSQNGILARFKTLWGGGVVLRARKIWHNSREP